MWGCLEQWGGEEVKDWYWCVWNEPNNPDIGGDITYAQYRRIYEELAAGVLALLEPHLDGRKARFGGPAIDGTQRAFWMDWIAQLVADLDDRMLGFVSWHMYADWRPAVPSEIVQGEVVGSPRIRPTARCSRPWRWRRPHNTKPARAALRGCCTAGTS